MLKPLQLGNKTFPVNIIQGPLAGVSCAPFRELTWRYSQPAFSCTEMISCKTLSHPSRMSGTHARYIHKSPKEGPVCFQLSGNNPTELAEAVKIATSHGADLIDLNCGCPVKKIRSKGAGSSLLMQPTKLYDLITAMKSSTHVPISIKIRVDNENDKQNSEIAKVVADAGADFLIVHGRHWTEHYDVSCRYDAIEYFVNELSIPVIGNGDISCYQSLQKMLATGCDGVMIARSGVGQPWLIKKLIAEMQNLEFQEPNTLEKGQVFIEHIHKLSALIENEFLAIMQARKIAKYYARGLIWREEFANAINHCHSLADLETATYHYFYQPII